MPAALGQCLFERLPVPFNVTEFPSSVMQKSFAISEVITPMYAVISVLMRQSTLHMSFAIFIVLLNYGAAIPWACCQYAQ